MIIRATDSTIMRHLAQTLWNPQVHPIITTHSTTLNPKAPWTTTTTSKSSYSKTKTGRQHLTLRSTHSPSQTAPKRSVRPSKSRLKWSDSPRDPEEVPIRARERTTGRLRDSRMLPVWDSRQLLKQVWCRTAREFTREGNTEEKYDKRQRVLAEELIF